MEQIYTDMPWAKDLISKADPIEDALRSLGYGLLKILARILDVLYDAIHGLLGIDILKIKPIQKFVDSVSPLGWSVLTISMIAAAFILMLYPRKDKGNMARGLLMAVCFMVSVPFLFQTLNNFRNAGVDDVGNSISSIGSPGQAIILSCTYDVANSVTGVAKVSNNTDPYYLDINARLPKDNSLFNKKITSVKDGVIYGKSLGNGFFGWGEERLYAYKFNFVEPLFILVIMLVCLLFTGFKLGRLLFDLVTHQVIAPIVFASDVSGNGRGKKFMQSLVSNYILMVLILVLLKIYLDLTTWTSTGITNVWVRILLIAGASWGVIDGPDIILKLIGVDAGTRNATAVMMGANAAANMGRSAGRTVSGAARTTGNVVRNAPGNIANMAGAVTGGVSGLKSMVGNAEMGANLAANANARSDAGISGIGDLRNGMRGTSDTQTQPSGYNNIPYAKTGGKQPLSDRFTASQEKVSSGFDRTAATVGYAAGKTAYKVGSAFKSVKGGQTPKTPPTSTSKKTSKPNIPPSNYKPPRPPDNEDK